MSENLNPTNNPRMRQDADGQWWYYTKHATRVGGERRHRCSIRVCAYCGRKYLHAQAERNRHCSHLCARNCLNCPGEVENQAKGHAARWRGGRFITPGGYVRVYSPKHHTFVGRELTQTYVFEHRLVMEEILGRPLAQNEQVHHRNGIKHDNRPENLELWVHSQPSGQRANEIRVPHCTSCTCFAHGE